MSARKTLKRTNKETPKAKVPLVKKAKSNDLIGISLTDPALQKDRFVFTRIRSVPSELILVKRKSICGVVLVTGGGDVGQLGLGSDVLEKSRPALLQLDQEIVDVCAGGMHTVCLTKTGKVITFGCNDEGALGRKTETEDAEFLPEEVSLPEKAIQISAGDSHTAVLLETGRVFVWGTFRDSHGNMGLTEKGNERLPYEMLLNNPVVKVASGADHLVMLTNHGHIYTCGCAEQGQLGRTTSRCSDRNARSGLILDRLLNPSEIQTKLSLKLTFDNIWAGTYCTFAKVFEKDDIYVCGLNNFNQLGLNEISSQYAPTLSKEFSKRKWKQICSGQHHTICLDDAGKVYVIGRKEYGRLGLGENCEDATELTEIPDLKNTTCVNIACGSASSFAVSDKGELYGWGMGSSGQLGTGSEEDCLTPTLIKGKQLQERLAVKVSSGGQHTVFLAVPADSNVHINDTK